MAHLVYKTSKGRVPSVTTIIGENLGWNKRQLMDWQAKMFRSGKDPDQIKTDAADIGTLCHTYIEAHMYGAEVSEEDKSKYSVDAIIIAEAGLEQFKRIVDELQLEFLETEMPLVSEKYQYGGCLDFLYKHPRVVYKDVEYQAIKCGLGDNKTSKAIYPDHLIQMGGYDGMVIESTKYRPEEFLFIKISKDITKPDDEIVKPVFVPSDKIKLGYDVFLDLRKHHGLKKELTL